MSIIHFKSKEQWTKQNNLRHISVKWIWALIGDSILKINPQRKARAAGEALQVSHSNFPKKSQNYVGSN